MNRTILATWRVSAMSTLTLMVAVMLVLSSRATISSAAEPDQHWAIERTEQAKHKLAEAKRADASRRRILMTAHMDMLGELLQELSTMKPDASLDMQQTAGWVTEHQRLTNDVLEQLVEEHSLMMKDLNAR